jgi:inward rectifier potassium channel
MAIRRNISLIPHSNNDTGFGNTVGNTGGRFVNKDGSFNIRREGGNPLSWFSMYYTLLNMPSWKFLLTVLALFLSINFFYTIVFLAIGVDQFTGFVSEDPWMKMKEIYYFSMQTFTTVGFGRINPVGDAASFFAGIEAMTGFLGFAWATGMMYGRFVRPKANLRFSKHAVIAPYGQITGLMFRFVAMKEKHTLTSVDVKVNLAMQVEENGKMGYKFFDLELERNHIDSLPMNFTVVHPIDENSPLYGMNLEDCERSDVEVYVLVRAFDDVYSASVQQRTSYTFSELAYGKKFVPMYRESEDGLHTILEMDKLDATKVVVVK